MSRIVSAIVTVSVVPAGAPRKLRMIRSRTRPIRGATTRSTMTRAIGTGTSISTLSCQYRNAATIPTAPWAKLKTPVVV
jgi:hypothetical protein